jgi:hypothetical protein
VLREQLGDNTRGSLNAVKTGSVGSNMMLKAILKDDETLWVHPLKKAEMAIRL